jgi:hypothetical protein
VRRARSLHTTAGAGPSRPTVPRAHASQPQAHARRAFHATAPSGVAQKNPYDALGVAKDADAKDIKKAYYAVS